MKQEKLNGNVESLLRARSRAAKLSRRTERTREPICQYWLDAKSPMSDWRVARDKELLERLKIVASRCSE
jgi:hypothetical protein